MSPFVSLNLSTKARIIEEKNRRTISFVNDSQGVSLMASPKHPQSVTLL